jgi:hypothetical protein
VALAAEGGSAEGSSRVAEDFTGAYSAALTIDGQFGDRWISAGPELTITLAKPATIDRVFFSSDRTGAAKGHPVASFVCEYRVEVSPDGQQWHEVANSHDRQPISARHRVTRLFNRVITPTERKRLAKSHADIARVDRAIASAQLPAWWVGNFRSAAGPFHVFLGGSPQRKGAEVQPASLKTLARVTPGYQLTADAPESQRRLELARWIASSDNPLTPRVLANRIWHYHFGTGIVDTPSDFGFMGGRPTHPELLDWLARQIHDSGWRIKPLHKLLMLSATYRQASVHRADAAKVDGDSRLLWRFPPRRLSGEEIRDSVLAIAGQLNVSRGGPGFRLYRYLQDNVATYVPSDRLGAETYRRSVYHQNARASRIDLMTEFDCPDCAFPTPRRVATTTPLQALTLMNHSFTMDMAGFLAERLERETAPADTEAQVHRAFRLGFSRSPSSEERTAAEALIEKHGLEAFCRAILNANELIYVD